ncbi:hypothetical protein LshimejAT787_1200310 [Lyophyllum shimeji]|uniref:Uncharacterized protein n=1 Tax=Lyophyllum shimeji TaxID=47721 RepID=A0A9P3URU3_LYOSH|nr:hypothetical protein LshimejAT787_1200310 [Lyophyllum shimeji]
MDQAKVCLSAELLLVQRTTFNAERDNVPQSVCRSAVRGQMSILSSNFFWFQPRLNMQFYDKSPRWLLGRRSVPPLILPKIYHGIGTCVGKACYSGPSTLLPAKQVSQSPKMRPFAVYLVALILAVSTRAAINQPPNCDCFTDCNTDLAGACSNYDAACDYSSCCAYCGCGACG